MRLDSSLTMEPSRLSSGDQEDRLRVGRLALLAGLFLGAATGQASGQNFTTRILAKGTAAETPYYVNDSGVPGPTVMVVGGVHGNEPAGSFAADQIRYWPIQRGKLVVLPRANVPALRLNQRYIPGVDRKLRDLNRNFLLEETVPRGPTAEAMWNLVCELEPTWLVDLHEGFDYKLINPASVGNSIIVYPTKAARRVTPRMLEAINATIREEDKKFIKLGPPVRNSLSLAVGEQLGANSMILETSRKKQPVSTRTRQHRILVRELLRQLKMIDDDVTLELVLRDLGEAEDEAPEPTKVALYDAGGCFNDAVLGLYQYFAEMKNTIVMHVGAEEIRRGALAQFDVVTFPDGSGDKQFAALGERGLNRLHEFVERGGGYVGICGGSHLACESLGLGFDVVQLRADPSRSHAMRQVSLKFSPDAQGLLGRQLGKLNIAQPAYQFVASTAVGIPSSQANYKVLAWLATQTKTENKLARDEQPVPAIVAGTYGKGRVMCITPPPTPALHNIVCRGVRWCAGGR